MRRVTDSPSTVRFESGYVVEVAEQSVSRAAEIRKPNRFLRLGIALLSAVR